MTSRQFEKTSVNSTSKKTLPNLVFVMPILNDYQSVEILISDIREVTRSYNVKFILVDDGSDISNINAFKSNVYNDIEILHSDLRSGHQIAIMKGLSYSSNLYPNANVVTLDSDGEDSAHNVDQLLNHVKAQKEVKIILVERGKRKNSFLFKLSYAVFKRLFKFTTGARLQSGNFLYIPYQYLESTIAIPETRLHISSAILRYSAYKGFLTLNRSQRIAGKSKMNLGSLSLHAFGAISVWSDVITVRLFVYLFGFALLGSVLLIGVLLLFVLGIFHSSVPGWTSVISIEIVSLFTFIMLQSIFATLVLLRVQQRFSSRRD